MAKPKTGAYAKLLANYAEDDAVIEAGEKAELLFVRSLAFCADSDADGFITDAQLARIVGAGMRDATTRARKLVEVGLWLREDGGYLVRSWTKLHETAEQRGRRLKADRERKMSARTPLPFPDGIQADDQPESERTEDARPADSLSMTVQDSAEQSSTTELILERDRNETLAAADATKPASKAEPNCSKHPSGNPTNEPCAGCAKVREHRDRLEERDRERRVVELEQAKLGCPDCEGTGKVLAGEDRSPTRRTCNHPKVRRSA